MGRGEVVPYVKTWYCYECRFGPLSDKIDGNCTSCGRPRCTHSKEELVPDLSFSVPRSREPRLEALPTASHVTAQNCSRRAATPFDNTGSAISSIGLRPSPLLPYPPYPTRVIGTSTGISTDTQPETSAQQSSQLALEQWNVSGSGINLVPVPIHEPFHGLFSSAEVPNYNDTRSRLHCSPQDPSPLCQLSTQFASSLAPSVDYSMQHASGTTRTVVGALQNIQHPPVESKTRLKRKHVAVYNTAADASAPNSETQSAQTCAVPMLPGRLAFGPVSSGWSEFPVDATIQFPVGSQIPSHSIRPTPLSWVPSDDYTALSPSPPSGPKLLSIIDSSQEGRSTHRVSRHHECCESSGSQRFACPFYKYDPKLYIHCMLKSFNSIGHMRQHLKYNHKLGPNHCKLCWRTFDTADSLTNHAQCCKTATGGVPVHDLPAFPRMRLPAEKKWYWGWKKLFGEAAAPPPCPFSHPLEDFQVRFRVQSPDLYVDFAEEEGDDKEEETNEHSLSMSPDWLSTDDEGWLTITERFAEIPSKDLNLSSSCPTLDTSPSTQSLDFSFEA
ncbi:hypothetical protein F4823DRAFT_628968 [Ustulina deusta]|nr:hypothetical protein F4823DRAFT_628968 [Ustulina deusta]